MIPAQSYLTSCPKRCLEENEAGAYVEVCLLQRRGGDSAERERLRRHCTVSSPADRGRTVTALPLNGDPPVIVPSDSRLGELSRRRLSEVCHDP